MDEHFPSYYGPSSITAGLDRIISRDIVDHTFDTPASATEQMVISPLTTRPAMEPKLPKKRRRLDYLKCDFCRRGKKKCEPSTRRWPGEKCQRCNEKGFTCSAPAKKTSGFSEALSVNNTSLVAVSDQDRLHEQKAYCALAEKCIEQMSYGLRGNICGLASADVEIDSISRSRIDDVLSESLQYACRFWIFLFCRGKGLFRDDMSLQNRVYSFLKNYLLYWLEALALLQLIDDGIQSLELLEQVTLATSVNENLRDFVHGAKCFILNYKMIVKLFPIAVYSNARLCLHGSMKEAYIPEVNFDFQSDFLLVENFMKGLTVLEGHYLRVLHVAFSPDGKLLATASYDKTVKLWDLTTRKEMKVFEHTGEVRFIAFSPDGNVLACVVNNGRRNFTIQLWQPATGEMLQVLSEPNSWILAIAFSPDGYYLMLAKEDGCVAMWDLSMRSALNRQVVSQRGISQTIVFSLDRTLLAWPLEDNKIKVLDIRLGPEKQTLVAPGYIYLIAFSQDSKLLAALCDETVTVWELATGMKLHTICFDIGTIGSITFLSRGRLLAFPSFDGLARLWDPMEGKERRFSVRGQTSKAIAYSPDNKHLARDLPEGSVELWELC